MSIKASTRTTLAWGTVRAPVALFKATGDKPSLPSFDKAGPNGYPIEANVRRAADPIGVSAVEDVVEVTANDPFEDIVAEAKDEPIVKPWREKHSGVELDTDEIRHGVFAGPEGETFIDCTESLKSIEETTSLDEMEYVGSVPAAEIERHRVRASYYLGTDGDGALSVLSHLYVGLRKAGRVGVVKLTKTSRQTLGILAPYMRAEGPVVMVLEIAWTSDIREAPPRAIVNPALVTPEGEQLATDLVRALAMPPAKIDELADDAIAMREELRAQAMEGVPLPKFAKVEAPSQAISIEDRLQESVEIERVEAA